MCSATWLFHCLNLSHLKFFSTWNLFLYAFYISYFRKEISIADSLIHIQEDIAFYQHTHYLTSRLCVSCDETCSRITKDLFVSIFESTYPDIRYAFKEISYLLNMSRYFKSKRWTRVSRRKHSRGLRSNGCESMSRIVTYMRIHAWPKPWHGSWGRSVPKFGNSIHSCIVTRPHNRGRRQTEIPVENAIIFFSESLRPGINAVAKPVVSLDKTAITPMLKIF